MKEPVPIPFNRFCKVGTEFAYIQQAIDDMHISGDGRFTAQCHALLEKSLGFTRPCSLPPARTRWSWRLCC